MDPQVPYLVQNLIFPCGGWFFILAVPAFSTSAKGPVQICASVAEELAGKNVIEYLTLLYVPGLPFFLERAHIFTNVPVEAFFCCCP